MIVSSPDELVLPKAVFVPSFYSPAPSFPVENAEFVYRFMSMCVKKPVALPGEEEVRWGLVVVHPYRSSLLGTYR